jgi:hypothetical protein
VIDPNAAPVRTAPREERDLFIAAGNGHLLAFDNLSDLPGWGSDALCRLASAYYVFQSSDPKRFRFGRRLVAGGFTTWRPLPAAGSHEIGKRRAIGAVKQLRTSC